MVLHIQGIQVIRRKEMISYLDKYEIVIKRRGDKWKASMTIYHSRWKPLEYFAIKANAAEAVMALMDMFSVEEFPPKVPLADPRDVDFITDIDKKYIRMNDDEVDFLLYMRAPKLDCGENPGYLIYYDNCPIGYMIDGLIFLEDTQEVRHIIERYGGYYDAENRWYTFTRVWADKDDDGGDW